MSFNPLGLVLPGAALGLGSLLIRPSRRGFLPAGGAIIVPHAVVEEHHSDDVEITEHPIENGASIADHAYKMPAEVTIRAAWSNSPPTAAGGSAGNLVSKAVNIGSTLLGGSAPILGAIGPTIAGAQSLLNGNSQGQVKQIYDKFLELQSKRILFDVLTGKRSYKSMLIKTLVTETDKNSENSMVLVITCRQVIIVTTQLLSTSADPAAQKTPEKTSATEKLGGKSLLPGANMIPDISSLTGSLGSLTSQMGNMQNILGSVSGSVMDAVGGALKGLPDVLGTAQSAISDTLSNIPLPFEIPTASSLFQNFSIPLDVGGLTSTVTESLNNLTPALEEARTAVINAGQQLPSVVNNFTADIAASIQTQAAIIPTQINGALEQVRNVFGRNQ